MKHIVVDLEMNQTRREAFLSTGCSTETIEIGAVMLDEKYNEISCFKTYVKPAYNDTIVSKITKLTGITYDMVADAPLFNEALRKFSDWCLSANDKVEIYAWGDTDFSQITKEIALKEYQVSEAENSLFLKDWNDFQREFDRVIGFQKNLSLKTALFTLGIDFSGQEHDALCDARNTGILFKYFKDEKLFKTTLKKIKEVMEPEEKGVTLGDMFDFSKFKRS